jgi:hypothetical protein
MPPRQNSTIRVRVVHAESKLSLLESPVQLSLVLSSKSWQQLFEVVFSATFRSCYQLERACVSGNIYNNVDVDLEDEPGPLVSMGITSARFFVHQMSPVPNATSKSPSPTPLLTHPSSSSNNNNNNNNNNIGITNSDNKLSNPIPVQNTNHDASLPISFAAAQVAEIQTPFLSWCPQHVVETSMTSPRHTYPNPHNHIPYTNNPSDNMHTYGNDNNNNNNDNHENNFAYEIPLYAEPNQPVISKLFNDLRNKLMIDKCPGFTDLNFGLQYMNRVVELLYALSSYHANLQRRSCAMPGYFAFSGWCTIKVVMTMIILTCLTVFFFLLILYLFIYFLTPVYYYYYLLFIILNGN